MPKISDGNALPLLVAFHSTKSDEILSLLENKNSAIAKLWSAIEFQRCDLLASLLFIGFVKKTRFKPMIFYRRQIENDNDLKLESMYYCRA